MLAALVVEATNPATLHGRDPICDTNQCNDMTASGLNGALGLDVVHLGFKRVTRPFRATRIHPLGTSAECLGELCMRCKEIALIPELARGGLGKAFGGLGEKRNLCVGGNLTSDNVIALPDANLSRVAVWQ